MSSVVHRTPGEDDNDDAPAIDLPELRQEEKEREMGERVLAARSAAGAASVKETQNLNESKGDAGAKRHRVPRSGARIVMSSIAPRDVEWLWAGRLPRGAVVSIDGLPQSGKSSLATEIVACVTTGRALYGATPTAPAGAIWIGHEEGFATILRPRLDIAEADTSRVFVYANPPSFPTDCDWLANEIRDTGAAIVVVDPIDAYLDFGDRGDSHRNGDVRARLVQLGVVAEQTGATIVMVRHWRKSGGTHALYRAAGSIAYSAMSRATISVVADPEDPDRRLATWSKMSDAPGPASIAFRLCDGRRVEWVGDDPRSATAVMAAADAAVSGREGRGDRGDSATDAAEAWLMEQLEATGLVPVPDLRAQADVNGLAWRTVERAKKRLGVQSRREGQPGEQGGGRWVWIAPQLKTAKTATGDRLAVLNRSRDANDDNSAPGANFGTRIKTANGLHRQTSLACLTSDLSESSTRAPHDGEGAE